MIGSVWHRRSELDPAMDYRSLSPRQMEQHALTIHPGAWAVDAERPLSTLLGSCVAVCLFDPLACIGGLNHFMLPSMPNDICLPDVMLSGEQAMDALLEALLRRGACRDRLQAKAFGGGTIFATSRGVLDVGQRNVSFARQWLEREAIPLLAADLLGPWSRKLVFLPYSGAVYCRRVATPVDWRKERGRDVSGHSGTWPADVAKRLSQATRLRRGKGAYPAQHGPPESKQQK